SGANARRDSAGENGFSPSAPDNCSRSFGNPSFMLCRIASATDNPVFLAVLRTSAKRSGGRANGYVAFFMEESYIFPDVRSTSPRKVKSETGRKIDTNYTRPPKLAEGGRIEQKAKSLMAKSCL